MVLLAGCRVDTRVSVVEHGGGDGTVAVTVTFDAAAVQALGGQAQLAKQLRYADLESGGWAVAGPSLLSGGAASVTVTHGFSSPSQLSQLMSSLAGDTSTHPFRLSVSDNGGFWTNKTVVKGAVDLRCGLDCFGDPGLQSALGGPLGVDPQPLEGTAGDPAQIFHFAFAVRLPGHVDPSAGNPVVARDGTLTWSPRLGSLVDVGAQSESVDWGHVVLVAVLAGLAVLGGGFGSWRPRRRRRPQQAPGDVAQSEAPVGEPVAAEPGGGDTSPWPTV